MGLCPKMCTIWRVGLCELKMSSGINFYDFSESTASFYKTTLAHFLIFMMLLFYFQSSLCDFFCRKQWLEVCLSFELWRHNYHCEDTWGCLSEVTSPTHKWSRNFIKMETVPLPLYSGFSSGCFTQKGNKALGIRWQIAPLFTLNFSLYNSMLSFLLRIIIITFGLEWVPQTLGCHQYL